MSEDKFGTSTADAFAGLPLALNTSFGVPVYDQRLSTGIAAVDELVGDHYRRPGLTLVLGVRTLDSSGIGAHRLIHQMVAAAVQQEVPRCLLIDDEDSVVLRHQLMSTLTGKSPEDFQDMMTQAAGKRGKNRCLPSPGEAEMARQVYQSALSKIENIAVTRPAPLLNQVVPCLEMARGPRPGFLGCNIRAMTPHVDQEMLGSLRRWALTYRVAVVCSIDITASNNVSYASSWTRMPCAREADVVLMLGASHAKLIDPETGEIRLTLSCLKGAKDGKVELYMPKNRDRFYSAA